MLSGVFDSNAQMHTSLVVMTSPIGAWTSIVALRIGKQIGGIKYYCLFTREGDLH